MGNLIFYNFLILNMKLSFLIQTVAIVNAAGSIPTWGVCVDDSSCAISTDKCCEAVSKTLGTQLCGLPTTTLVPKGTPLYSEFKFSCPATGAEFVAVGASVAAIAMVVSTLA